MSKQHVRIIVTGTRMTLMKQQEVAQAIMITLAHHLDGEISGVAIRFEEESQ